MLKQRKISPFPPRSLALCALIALCVLYLFTGLLGRDPWKGDDAIHFGIAYEAYTNGHWLVPHLAGLPSLDNAPLYYWIAALCGQLFGGLLPLPDAIRLSSGLCGAAFLILLTLAAQQLHTLSSASRPHPAAIQKQQTSAEHLSTAYMAPLIAIGSLGLLLPIHDTQTSTALLAASAASYFGYALLLNRPLLGGMTAGLGLGLGFLASGVTALLTLAPLLILLPCSPHWRTRKAIQGLSLTLLLALTTGASWPLLLAWQEPSVFANWYALNLGNVHLQTRWLSNLPDFAQLLVWFAWPALPLAIWTLWFKRQQLQQAAIALPLIGSISTLLILVLFSEPRPTQTLPLLPPLILLATNSAHQLRRGASNAFDWFGMLTFSIVAGLIWLGGIAMTSGYPTQIARNFAKLEPGFIAQFSPWAYLSASIATLVWLWLIIRSPRSPWRAVSHWAAGMLLIWILLMNLWLPWIDYGKTYRHVMLSLKQAIATQTFAEKTPVCIAERQLGSAQKVALHYFANIRTRPSDTPAAHLCPLLIEQGDSNTSRTPAGWKKIWEGHRAGDRHERLRLYRKESAENS